MQSFNKTCQLLDEYLHSTLEPELQTQFHHHLDQCAACAEAVANWQTINTALQQSFQNFVLPNPHQLVGVTHSKLNEFAAGDFLPRLVFLPRLLSLAATLTLAATLAMTWMITKSADDRVETGTTRTNQQDHARSESTIYAAAVFDEQTIAVRKWDDPEITIYQVYPKVTLRSVE